MHIASSRIQRTTFEMHVTSLDYNVQFATCIIFEYCVLIWITELQKGGEGKVAWHEDTYELLWRINLHKNHFENK